MSFTILGLVDSAGLLY